MEELCDHDWDWDRLTCIKCGLTKRADYETERLLEDSAWEKMGREFKPPGFKKNEDYHTGNRLDSFEDDII